MSVSKLPAILAGKDNLQEESVKRSVLSLLFAMAVLVSVGSSQAQAQTCAKIKDGTILDSAGAKITLGYDQYGYNYQARMFNGTYDSVDRNLDGLYFGSGGDYVDDSLLMKWSDEWISNLDCNFDQKLDRGLDAKTGASTGLSRGWLTNQIEGDYIGSDGDSHHYTYFAKIVYDGGTACSASSPACLWGTFVVVEEIYNDPYNGYHGVDHSRLTKPGLGLYK